MTTSTLTIHAIPSDVLAELRGMRGLAIARMTAEGGEPLRCCLRDARVGERCLLVNYEPPLPPSPYREVGAVFIHADDCGGPGDDPAYPADWYGRAQVLRAYDERGWIHPATRTHDGTDPETVIAEVLSEPGVVQVHSRNVAYGCYMFSATA
jgi:hypothetical protein